MYDTHHRYVAVAFVDAESVKTTRKEIIKILDSVDFLDLQPAQVQELNASGATTRSAFISEDQISQLVLLTNSFQFVRISNQAGGIDLGDFSEFCDQADKLITLLSDIFQKVPHRLALIREGFLNRQESEVNQIAQRLLTLPPVFKDKNLIEWDWRVSAQVKREFGSLSEDLNTIGIIKRVNATRTLASDTLPAPTENISLIRVDVDINTWQLDLSPRFKPEVVTDFFKQGVSWHSEFESQLLDLINGRAQ